MLLLYDKPQMGKGECANVSTSIHVQIWTSTEVF